MCPLRMGYDVANSARAEPGWRDTMMPKSAMVLAAGLGTRMRPYNGHIPKPLVDGRRQVADRLRARPAGRCRRRARGGQRASSRRRAGAASRRAPAARASSSPTSAAELLGTGGGIAKALPQLGDAPFFLINSDTLWLDGVQAQFRAARRSLRPRRHGRAAAAGADRRQHRLCRPRRLRHAAGRPPAAPRRARKWCRSSMPAPRSWRRRCSPTRRPAPFR